MSKLIYVLPSLIILFFSYIFYNKEIEFFDIVELDDSTGAKCLDGSPYTFTMKKGSGDGINNFILFFDGGGWCSKKVYNSTLESCSKRAQTYLGSSDVSYTQKFLNFIGKYPMFSRWGYILSSDSVNNPTFHNWNKVFINYCDGRGFVGFNNDPIIYNNKPLYFRGYNNTVGVLNYLKQNLGLVNSKNVIISGVSAGGISSLVYSNFIAEYLPNTNVKTISDSGVFLNFENQYNPSYNFSMVWKDLIKDTKPELEPLLKSYCTEDEKWKCFLLENFYENIKVPVYLIQSQYDIYEICNLIGGNCNLSLFSYNVNTFINTEKHREKFLELMTNIKASKKNWGIWSPACYLHDFIMYSFSWNKKVMNNTSLNEAITSWFLEKNQNNYLVDNTEWPNNKECAYSKDALYYMMFLKINTDIF